MIVVLSGVVAGLGCIALAFPHTASVMAKVEVPAPAPSGMPWRVAHARSSLVDSSRKDPYNSSEDRKIAFSVFMPILDTTCTATTDDDYMPKLTAEVSNEQFFGNREAGVFEQLYFKSCSGASGETPADHFPLLLFEPAVGTSRFMYNQLARQLSANGAYIVTIDHPHDAPIVEFADSDPIENKNAITLDPFKINKPVNDTDIKKVMDTRIGDINAVIKELEQVETLPDLFPGVRFVNGNTKVPTQRIFMAGHGLGGSVAIAMGASDERVVWTINLSGSAPALTQDIFAYTIFFGREDYRSEDDTAWQETRKHLAGPQVEWTYNKAEQFDYSDLPLVSQLVGKNSDAKGLGKPYEVMDLSDPTATFRSLSCFLEAYFRQTVLPEWFVEPRLPGASRDAIRECIGWFGGAMKMHVPGGN
ncbi:hypothetical protein BU23DRAFT_44434 [Bimuria novae-zelandiae CBS 107.79]|uniref:Uncharacterized protein n=1 Tax=Bimuria novae-zelandiae CBS 107.79 TaxID=1447943 RepID=A0A6A5VGG7_9PLEO|nr:hypothetical protein BU23DRAFT_44434 [Bimuria novae-zelandiae CBS 107.79]